MTSGVYIRTKKHKRKMSESHKGQIPWIKGKKQSEKTKEQISKSLKGHIVTKETRIKLRKINIGKKLSEEHKRKMSLSHKSQIPWIKGKKHSLETKKKISKRTRMENNAQWLGGKSFEPYDQRFNNKFKRFIRKRDNQICMLCNTHREKLNRALSIHHVDYDKLNTIKENCLALCVACNSKVNYNREEWIIFFRSLLNKRYGYEYKLKKEVNKDDRSEN
jgi:hypothetical protein